jgi:hypothetical protein
VPPIGRRKIREFGQAAAACSVRWRVQRFNRPSSGEQPHGTVVVALLGFGGIVSALRSAAWIILVIAIVVIVLSFIF